MKYYGTGTYECIKVIRAWELDFELGNVLKYVKRAGRKDPKTQVQDLRKAINYLEMEIDRVVKDQWEDAKEQASRVQEAEEVVWGLSPEQAARAEYKLLGIGDPPRPVTFFHLSEEPFEAPAPEEEPLEDLLERLFAEPVGPPSEDFDLEDPDLLVASSAVVDLVAMRYDEPQEGM